MYLTDVSMINIVSRYSVVFTHHHVTALLYHSFTADPRVIEQPPRMLFDAQFEVHYLISSHDLETTVHIYLCNQLNK